MASTLWKPKIQNLRKLEYYMKSIKKGFQIRKCWPYEKYNHAYVLSSWFGPLLHELLMRRGMDAISLWHCWGVMDDQDASISAFSSLALFGLMSFIFLLAMPHRFSMGFRSGEFAGQSRTVIPWSLNQVFVVLAVWAGAKSLTNKCWKYLSWGVMNRHNIWDPLLKWNYWNELFNNIITYWIQQMAPEFQ